MAPATRPAPLPLLPPALVAAAALLASFVAGVAMASGLAVGLGLVIALLYAPLVVLNLRLGIVLWIPLLFLANLEIVSVGPTAAAILIALAWLGTLRSRGSETAALLRRHAHTLAAVAAFLIWITLSLSWARDMGGVNELLVSWYLSGLLFVVFVTTISTPAYARLAAGAFVASAVLAVVIALATQGLVTDTDSAVAAAADEERRLQGAGNDPNFLAAGIVPAIVLAGGLAAGARTLLPRLVLAVAVATLTLGFAAAESRGGLVAAAVAVLGALIFYRGRRGGLVVFLAFIVAVGAGWFVTSPAAWDRITNFDSEGNGRTELWTVASRIWRDHPVVGVGLGNFPHEAPEYVRRPGSLEFVDLIAERPHVAHQTYLQLLAETGVIGALLFVALQIACFRAAWRAGHRFEEQGDQALAALSRSVLVAGMAMMAASLFLSNGSDKRLWILMALGPVMLALSRRPDPSPQGNGFDRPALSAVSAGRTLRSRRVRPGAAG